MVNHDDSPNRSFQIYPLRKRKLFDLAQHNGSTINVSGGTSVVAIANGSYTGNLEPSGITCASSSCHLTETHLCSNLNSNQFTGCSDDNETRDHCQTVVVQEAPSRYQNVDMDDSVVGKTSHLFSESLWDGTILLTSSVKASMVAFFESGEKIQDIPWPELILIKGRVQLVAFKEFIQELPHSRNRAIMVISLCWKVGSSKVGLKGMKEVASNFEVNQRVGLADIYEGCSLYVCPRSEAIITVLYENGFLKGKPTNDTNQESLLGLVVWNRKPLIKVSNDSECETGKGPLSACADGITFPTSVPCSDSCQATPYSNSVDMASVRNTSMDQSSIEKIQEMQGTYANTQHVADDRTGEKVYHPEAAIPNSPSKLASTLFLQSPQITSFRGPSVIACDQSQVPQMSSHEVPNVLLTTPETRQQVQPNKDSNCGPLGVGHPGSYFHVAENPTSAFKPYKTDLLQSQDVPQGAIHSDLATQKNFMVGPFSGSITQQKHASSTSGSPEMQQTCSLLRHPDSFGAHTPDDKDDLPEFDFPSIYGAEVKNDVHPLDKETAGSVNGLIHHNLSDNESGQQFQQPSHSFFQVESIRPHENVGAQGTSTDICSEKITNPTSHCTTERVCFRDNYGVNNGGMTKRHLTDLAHEKLYKTRAVAQPQSLPPITPTPQSPPRAECLSMNHRPHMPSGCSNPPRDEIFFPHHHPNVEANQGLSPRHPSIVADQGLFPRQPPGPPPVLADEGLLRVHPRGLFGGHPPPARPDQALFRLQPIPILAYQGFFPRHPSNALENGGFFPRHPSHVLGDQGFIARPTTSAPGYFNLGDHGDNNGTSPHQQRRGTSYAATTSGQIRPPNAFAPWRPISHPRPGNNSFVFERSGDYSSTGNGSGSRPPSSGQQ